MTRRNGHRVPSEVEPSDSPTGGKWRANNLRIGIRRRERRLKNSMAHTPQPRPADMVRWRAMQAEIDSMAAQLDELRQQAAGPPNGEAPEDEPDVP